jgi:hypothetical protein
LVADEGIDGIGSYTPIAARDARIRIRAPGERLQSAGSWDRWPTGWSPVS